MVPAAQCPDFRKRCLFLNFILIWNSYCAYGMEILSRIPARCADRRAVVGHRNALLSGTLNPRHHIFAVKHARAALDDEISHESSGSHPLQYPPQANRRSVFSTSAESFLFRCPPSAAHGYSTPRSVPWNGRSATRYALPPPHSTADLPYTLQTARKRMSMLSAGLFFFADIASNTWESVMISFGAFFNTASAGIS